MSTINSLNLHPILEDFCAQFVKAFPQAKGEEHADEVIIEEKSFEQRGCYYVCNSAIKLDMEDKISIEGSSLLAGRLVELKASQISLIGTKEKPTQIVGLDSVRIQATTAAKVKNLEIYLLKGAPLSFSAKDFSEFENVKIIRMELKGEDLTLTSVVWKTHFDYLTYCQKEESKKLQAAFKM